MLVVGSYSFVADYSPVAALASMRAVVVVARVMLLALLPQVAVVMIVDSYSLILLSLYVPIPEPPENSCFDD